MTKRQAQWSGVLSPHQAQGSRHPPNPAGTRQPGRTSQGPAPGLSGRQGRGLGRAMGSTGDTRDGCGTGPLRNLHDEGQVGVPAAPHLPCLGGRRTGPHGVREGVPSQLYHSFCSAHSPFCCFGALPGAPDRSVCRRVPVVPAMPAALPMGWMVPAPQPGFLPGAGYHWGNHPWIIWG